MFAPSVIVPAVPPAVIVMSPSEVIPVLSVLMAPPVVIDIVCPAVFAVIALRVTRVVRESVNAIDPPVVNIRLAADIFAPVNAPGVVICNRPPTAVVVARVVGPAPETLI